MAGNDHLAVVYDRDMRIRLSHYPEVYAIYSFALGHTECVRGAAVATIWKSARIQPAARCRPLIKLPPAAGLSRGRSALNRTRVRLFSSPWAATARPSCGISKAKSAQATPATCRTQARTASSRRWSTCPSIRTPHCAAVPHHSKCFMREGQPVTYV